MSNKSEFPFIIAIGASAGGLTALCELVASLPADLPAPVCIVLHLSRKGIGDYLRLRLQGYTEIPCEVATHNGQLQAGHIYIAPPDQHLVVKGGHTILGTGPEENRWRPSIDVLLRSAAVAYGDRSIGIILTGLLNDGTAGMDAIRLCGGATLVQDPQEAQYPDMPLSVLSNMEVDHCIPVAQMAEALAQVMAAYKPKNIPIPPGLLAESQIAEKTATGMEHIIPLGEQSVFTCPDCGGILWEMSHNHPPRYRCYIGHSYSEADLIKNQYDQLEASLWVAVRMLEERRSLMLRICERELSKGFTALAGSYTERAEELKGHIATLKQFLFSTQEDNENGLRLKD